MWALGVTSLSHRSMIKNSKKVCKNISFLKYKQKLWMIELYASIKDFYKVSNFAKNLGLNLRRSELRQYFWTSISVIFIAIQTNIFRNE